MPGRLRPTWDSYLRVEFLETPLTGTSDQTVGRVLDIGAGTGSLARDRFSRDFRLVPADIVPHDGIDVLCSMTDLPFREGAFDLVLAIRVLQHVAREEQALGEVLRVTRHGGRFLFAVANRNSWTLLGARSGNPRWRRKIPYACYRLYSREDLAVKLRQTGFGELRIRSAIFLPEIINRLPLALSRVLLRLGRFIDHLAHRIPVIRNMGTNWVVLGVKA